ncbi:hypothetical protein M413DRAFT_411566 [Hebeloma cylindrosporum]|uniref:Tail specific protease domain-containing protein n=1 Tax=Hebeloma cylindrosporum TaxID=76867 RepID=A0A0C2XVI4_HEBCY|nr:hypothetical protein M413DRAFT_411566 [Hebeloma cylindrosporum h7]
MARKMARLLPLLLVAGCPALSLAASSAADPCVKIADQEFVPPADALACYKTFPFNETLRQNVLTNVARVFNFFTFEDFYLNSPPPFQESTSDIRATLAKINSTKYETDYDFNKALYDFTTQLNDGHTRYFPACYNAFQNILPAPVVSLEENGVQNLFVAPDSVEFLSQLGAPFTNYFDSIKFDWKRLAGAKILQIDGMDPYDYVDLVARTVSGNYLDHGVRVNSVFTSYRISGSTFSQRLGDLAGPIDVTRTSLKFELIAVNSTKVETVDVPYLASFIGVSFTDRASFWRNNCAANELTNGADVRTPASLSRRVRKQPRAEIIDGLQSKAVDLPQPFLPIAPPINGSDDVIKTYILPGGKTGVMFVGSFSPSDYSQFQVDTVAAVNAFKAAGVSQLLIDLTNNGGGYVCLGQFLHQYLVGSQIGYPGFQSTQRANALAQKIVAAHVALGQNDIENFYSPHNWAFQNDTIMPVTFNYNDPSAPFMVNGRSDPTSQRFHDTCTESFTEAIPTTPPFDLNNVAIVSNGNCASTCAMFSTLMNERHNTKIAVFGGKPGETMEFKGMAGNQVLEWAELDTEIKSVGLKDDPLAPPDL